MAALQQIKLITVTRTRSELAYPATQSTRSHPLLESSKQPLNIGSLYLRNLMHQLSGLTTDFKRQLTAVTNPS